MSEYFQKFCRYKTVLLTKNREQARILLMLLSDCGNFFVIDIPHRSID